MLSSATAASADASFSRASPFGSRERACAAASVIDFGELLLRSLELLRDNLELQRQYQHRFKHVLVDEFQDTNAIQYRLVKAFSRAQRNLCVVGDDDQSIYSWRGADVRNILDFRRDFPDATVVKLEQNYRSSRNIVAVALGVIKSAAGREPKNLWSSAAAGDRVIVRGVRDERDEAVEVVRLVRREVDRGISPREIAVFYRVHAQSRVLEEVLRSENIAYQIVGGMKFFERAEVKNLLAYLRLVDNPDSDGDLLRILNVPTRGIGQKTAESLLQIAARRSVSAYRALGSVDGGNLGSGPKRKLGAFRDLIEELRGEATTRSVSDIAELVLDRTAYRKLLQDEDTAEADARLENLAELVGSMKEYEKA
jgi:DNA helicase-2/ATP-dependent DNA helicase PcrA